MIDSFFLRTRRMIGFLFLIFLTGCEFKKEGYQDLDNLFADFSTYLKASDDSLRSYCYKITPDESTLKYMEKHDIHIGGIPKKLRAMKADVRNDLQEKYFQKLLNFKHELKSYNQLEQLEYIGREETGERLMNKELNIYAVETNLVLKSGNDTLFFTLGEMYKMQDRWLSFTKPRINH
ncbi:MAG TPA: hypothetical protein PKY29_07455 [Ferruginibacter sp.]|nr:hypothetical protein [Ferruginibacter sp.]HRO18569.1 hypothetical protein [Ferruginibacter sp.]HRQ21133.1 hypothetical protein [Ferruginibacter sp.]